MCKLFRVKIYMEEEMCKNCVHIKLKNYKKVKDTHIPTEFICEIDNKDIKVKYQKCWNGYYKCRYEK